MRLFTFFAPDNTLRTGLETGADRLDFTALWHVYRRRRNQPDTPDATSLQDFIDNGLFRADRLSAAVAAVADLEPLDGFRLTGDIRFDVPLGRQRKIICIGRNYRAHAREMGNQVPEAPMFFSKLTSALVAHGEAVRLPAGIGRVDHEIELAVVIGSAAFQVTPETAQSCVAGYTIANDISARELQHDVSRRGQPWTLCKGMDTFCPLGPYLVPADAIPDPHDLSLEMRVNGGVRQQSSTADMVFRIPELLAAITRHITLYPGDIVCTGTPEGVSPIHPGDTLEAAIDGLGVLRNPVIAR